jgi:Rrf2 family protein
MASVLKISDAAAMALHAVAFLACNDSRPVATHTIAEAIDCSEAHLSKVLQRLTRAGLVYAERGPHGGFYLDIVPEDITFLDVYEAIDGELPESDCLFNHPTCNQSVCILGGLLCEINNLVRTKLKQTNFGSINCEKWLKSLNFTKPALR